MGTLTYNTTKVAPSHIYRATGGGATFSSNYATSAAFDYFTDTFAVNDCLYIGKSAGVYYNWSDVVFNIGTAIAGTGITGVWEYYKYSAGWTTITNFIDDTVGFTATGSKTFKFGYQENWTSNVINGVTGSWIRYRITAYTTRTEGGANVTTAPTIGNGTVNVTGYTDGSPCTLALIYDYINTNYSYLGAVKNSNYYDFRRFSVSFDSPTVSYNEILEIGMDMIGSSNLRSYWNFDYWTTGRLVGTNHGKQGSKIVINAINSYPLTWTANQKSYGATYFSNPSYRAGYPNILGTFYDCLLQIAPGSVQIGDCQNCTFETGFGFISSTWVDPTQNPFANNTIIVTGSSAWTVYNRSFDIIKPNIIFDNNTGYLLSSGQNNVGGLVWNFIDAVNPLPAFNDSAKPMYMSAGADSDLMNVFLYDDSAGTYTDYTTQASSATADDVPLYGDVGDCLYLNILSSSAALQHASFTMTSGANDYVYEWEYYKSGVWKSFSNKWDETLNLTQTGVVWVERASGDITLTTVNGVSGYWYRLRIVTKGTTTKTATQIRRKVMAGTADWNLNYKYSVNYTAKDSSGNLLEGVEVAIYDKNGDLQFSGTTGVNGTIPAGNLTTSKYYFDPLDPNRNAYYTVEKLYNPFNFRSRRYGYMARDISTNVDSPQKPVNVFTPNPNVVVDQATAHAYTGISITGNTITINEDHTMQEVYDYCEDWYSLTPNMMKNEPFETTDGQNFFSTYDLILDGSHLTGTGRINIVVNTVTYLNNATSTLDIVAIDGTHTNIKVTDIIVGSLVEIYDMDNDVQMYCEYTTGTEVSIPALWNGDRDILISVSYVDGVTAKEFWQVNASLTANGINQRVRQVDNELYNDLAIDGSLVDEYTIDDSVLVLQINDLDGRSMPQRAFAYNVYWLFTKEGITDREMLVKATSLTEIKLLRTMKISNVSGIPVAFYDGYFVDREGSTDPENIYDMNSDPMFLAYGQAIGLAYNVNGITEEQLDTVKRQITVVDKKVDDTQTRVITMTE